MLHQPGSAQDDAFPVGSKELFMKRLRSESKILFNGCLPMTPVFWPPIDDNAVHINHQRLNRQAKSPHGSRIVI